MKTSCIPRTNYEVYFITAEKKRLKKKAIDDYLRSRHPFYSRSSRIERMACLINERPFEMVTVFPAADRLRFFGLFTPQKTTQTSIIARSSFGRSACIVRSPGELLFLDNEPKSEAVDDDAPIAVKVDRTFRSIAEIEKLAETERISRFDSDRARIMNRLKRIIPIVLPVCLIIECATAKNIAELPDRKPVVQNAAHYEDISTVPDDFASCLAADIDMIHEAGCTIRSYRYDRGKDVKTSLTVRGRSSADLAQLLSKKAGIFDISIQNISWQKNNTECSIAWLRKKKSETKPTVLPLVSVRNLEALFLRLDVYPETLQVSPRAEFSIRLHAEKVPTFIEEILIYCEKEMICIHSISILDANDKDSATVVFHIAFSSPPVPSTTKPNEKYLRQAFFNEQPKVPVMHQIASKSLVGKITERGLAPLTFQKDESGKMKLQGGKK